MKKFILTELEKKRILKMYGLIKEQEGSDPTNPDAYPDQDEWGYDDSWSWDEWKIYYETLKKKYGENFAKKRFLKYWEVVQNGMFADAKDGMEKSWFEKRKIWNVKNNRPFLSSELPELPNKVQKPTGVSDKLVEFVKKEEFFVPCVYDDYKSNSCIRGEMKKCCLRGKKPTGKSTIGYGTVFYPDGKKVTPKDPDITKEKASNLLKVNLNKFAKKLISIYPNLKQHQLDGLTSLCYNTGLAGCTTKAPNLSNAITQNPDSTKNNEIMLNFLDFENKKRREKEFKIYHQGKYE